MRFRNTPSAGIIPFLLFVLLLPTTLLAAAGQPLLEKILFKAPGATTEQITFQLSTPVIPKVFAIKGEKPRVIFDFPQVKPAPAVARNMPTKGHLVQGIRVGVHPGAKAKTRVVLDLVPGNQVDFKQNFDKKHNALIVSLTKGGAAPATQPPSSKPAPKKIQVKPTVPPQPSKKSDQAVAPAPSAAPAPTKEEKKSGQPATPVEKHRQSTPPPEAPPVSEKQAAPKPKASTPILKSVEFDGKSSRGEMILFHLNDFYPPVVFGIEEGNPRVVCDFKKTRGGKGLQKEIKAHGRYVRSIRIGQHRNPDKIRVVLDLKPNNNYDLQQVFFKEDNLFVIIVNVLDNLPANRAAGK